MEIENNSQNHGKKINRVQNDEDDDQCRVQVAVRIRPLIQKEIINNESECIQCDMKKNQVKMKNGLSKEFTFDKIFDQFTDQSDIYNQIIHNLLIKCFNGYNATVIAYGQTGSGKTYTMGTSGNPSNPCEQGIVNRVIYEFYNEIEARKNKSEFRVKVTYFEIYNDNIIDLFQDSQQKNKKDQKENGIVIQEELGQICIYGINVEPVNSPEEMLMCLERGGMRRSTSSTLMNNQSSRSHAIFTIYIEQHHIEDLYQENHQKVPEEGSTGFITSKFHFVDLAGSERLKKTCATGAIMKEGININMGLSALGNVISQLTKNNKQHHIPYRDSKLTRILQDSLGGNSNTIMIACVSPADSNYDESLITLNYAQRARMIKNKPIINKDPQSALISSLKQMNNELRIELTKYRTVLEENNISVQNLSNPFKIDRTPSKIFCANDEGEEIKQLKIQNLKSEKKCIQLQTEIQALKKNFNDIEIELYNKIKERDSVRLKYEKAEEILLQNKIQINFEQNDQQVTSLVQEYCKMNQKLKSELIDKEKLIKEMSQEVEQLIQSNKKEHQILSQKINQNEVQRRKINSLEHALQKQSQIAEEDQKIATESDDEEIDEEELCKDQNFKEEKNLFESYSKSIDNDLRLIDQKILKDEGQRKVMTEHHLDLQQSLIVQMKEEYYQKIQKLEKEKIKLEEKFLNLNQNETQEKQQKIAEMVQQIKDLQNKEKKLNNLKFKVESQEKQIQSLDQFIKDFKKQKIDLNKQLQSKSEGFQQFKQLKYKELINEKKKGQQKDNQIIKLQRDVKNKANQIIKQKDLNSKLKKQKELLQKIIKPPKKIYPTKNSIKIDDSIEFNENEIENYLETHISKLLKWVDINIQLCKLEQDLKIIDDELQYEQQKQSDCIIDIESLQLSLQEQTMDLIEQEQTFQRIKELNVEQNHYKETIEAYSDKYNYMEQQLKQKKNMNTNNPFEQIQEDLLLNSKLKDNIINYRLMVKVMIEKFINLAQEIVRKEEALMNFKLVLDNQEKINAQQQQQLKLQELESERIVNQMQYMIDSIIKEEEIDSEDHGGRSPSLYKKLKKAFPTEVSQDKIEFNYMRQTNAFENKQIKPENQLDLQKKEKIKEINELNKKYNFLQNENQKLKIQLQMYIEKYKNLSKITQKDKFIGNQFLPSELLSLKDRRKLNKELKQNNLSHSPDGIKQVLEENLLKQSPKLEQTTQFGEINEDKNQNNISMNAEFEVNRVYAPNKWNLVHQFNQAHNMSVTCLRSQGQLLYSTSQKSLKVWDLEKMILLHDIHVHTSIIKGLVLWPEQNMIAVTCDKSISLLDMSNYNYIGQLKGHKDQVNCLHVTNDYLFSGGKGGVQQNSLLIWDIKNYNQPLDEKEKNYEIKSFTSTNNILYYGTRQHQVRRINISKNFEIMAPLDPPHYDTVSAIGILRNRLISGSRGSDLKLWNIDPEHKGEKQIFLNYGNDGINSIQTIDKYSIVYCGTNKGKIKVWYLQNDKLECIHDLNNSPGTVNSLCSVTYDQNEDIIAAGSEKVIKLWRPNKETYINMRKMEEEYRTVVAKNQEMEEEF